MIAPVVQYTEWKTLSCRGAVDPAPPEEVEGSLLVGTRAALSFYEGETQYGSDHISILPAFHKGERCWIKQAVWSPAFGYSASGTIEWILSFEEGVKLFLEREVFAFPAPVPAKA